MPSPSSVNFLVASAAAAAASFTALVKLEMASFFNLIASFFNLIASSLESIASSLNLMALVFAVFAAVVAESTTLSHFDRTTFGRSKHVNSRRPTMPFDVVSASASAWKTDIVQGLGESEGQAEQLPCIALSAHGHTGMQSGDTPCSWSST